MDDEITLFSAAGPALLMLAAVMAGVCFQIDSDQKTNARFMAGAFDAANTSEQGRQQVKSVLSNGGNCSTAATENQKVCGMLKDAFDSYMNTDIDRFTRENGSCSGIRFDMLPACEAARHVTLEP